MMKNDALPSDHQRHAAFGWLACCLLLLVSLLVLLPHARINSSVLALLPDKALGDIPPALSDGLLQRLDSQLVWLVSPGKTADPQVAQQWLSMLRQLPALSSVQGPMDQQAQQQWGRFFYQHRNGNLDAQTRARLQQGGATQAQWVLAQLYSAFSGVTGTELRNDPLMLVRGAQLALSGQATSHMQINQGWLVTQDQQGNYWYLLHGELRGSSFDMQQNHQTVNKLTQLTEQLTARYPYAKILSRGTLFYSEYASQQAKHDVSTLGVTTILGVIALIFVVFRSLRPLLLCLLSIAMGALAGTVTVLVCYGELHLITLVMSLSIVGISADYTLYFLTERMVHGQQVSSWQSLRKVKSALLLALLTTVLAYLIMMLAPFPGIRQLALFAAAGLSASCLTVICWHPWLSQGLPVRPVPAMGLMLRWLAAWRRQKWLYIGLPVLLTVLALAGLSRLTINDDIAQLQALPAGIQAQEQQIGTLTGQSVDQRGFIVYANSPQATLQRLEQFEPLLAKAQHEGWLAHYRILPLNSLARQQQDQQLIARAAPLVEQALAQAGIDNVKVDSRAMPVSVTQWLHAPVSEGWRLLWITLADGRSGVLVPVDGVTNSNALAKLAQTQPGVGWLDRKAAFDHLFSLYRSVFSGLLTVALVIIAIGTVLRLGWRKGLISLIPSLLSLICGLAALALSGQPVNLFALLALALVLGIGINYTLFFSNPHGTPLTSLLAISLAMCTTLLTLGMLVFSGTQAISSFGIVLCSGIFTAFLLSPLAMPARPRSKK